MSKIAFLSWNIENLGVKKTTDSNGEIFNLIAFVAKQTKADVIGLMEMPITAPSEIFTGIITALAAITDGDWDGDIISPRQKETYFLLWRTDKFFKKLKSGLTTIDKDGNELKFPNASGLVGGREAAYCCFENKSQAGKYFNYLAFHAPGPGGTYTAFGGHQLSKAWPLYNTKSKNNPVPVSKVIIGGDFNVQWNETNKGSLTTTTKASTSGPSTTASGRPRRGQNKGPITTTQSLPNKTICYGSLMSSEGPNLKAHIENTPSTLKNEVTNTSLSDFTPCYASTYDHFFEKGLTGTIESGIVPILQWLSDGTCKQIIENYRTQPAVFAANLNWEVHPTKWVDRLTKKDAWQFYRRLVSDHLPISLSGNV